MSFIPVQTFVRGSVIKAKIPPIDDKVFEGKGKDTGNFKRPSFVIEGEHRFVMLHDSDQADIDSRWVLAAPITSASAEAKKALKEGRSILASYIPVERESYTFLEHDSYISSAQIFPMNRLWLYDVILGQISPEKMAEFDTQLIRNTGLMPTVLALAKILAVENYGIDEAAAGQENA
ncbi:PemK-like protein [Paenibacillus pasadenensis]|uniref:hypothetical protein n=1 Tax=Paenibacillus pasadenensis TaxID=217090 RepID=UPI0004192319|nr:hypothetical protein [Paenibacillus pasadenensis]